MGPAIYVIAILGCGEGDTACQPVALVDSRYESAAECNAAAPDAAAVHMDIAFPVVIAQCQKAGTPASQTVFPSEIMLPQPMMPEADKMRVRQASLKREAPRG